MKKSITSACARELLTALETLARYANGRLGKNPYLIPEYKQALIAICRARGLSTENHAWMDVLPYIPEKN